MTNSTISETDKQLIALLDSNARMPLAHAAKVLRISKGVAAYRFAKLQERGIIKGAFTEINTVAVGYMTFRVLLRFGQYTPAMSDSLEQDVIKRKEVIWLTRVLGPWDIDLLFATKNIATFEEFRKELFTKHNRIIEEHHISILADILSYPKEFIARKTANTPTLRQCKHFVPTTYLTDDDDERILRLLSVDAMMSLTTLAQKARLSVNTVRDRMRKMENGNIILRYRLYLDTNKLGYEYFKLHVRLRNYDSTSFGKIQAYLEALPHVVYIDKYINGDDLEIEVQLEDEQRFAAFLNQLLTEFGDIIKSHTLMKFYDEKIFRFLPEE